jgi:hypothetical protein
MKNTATIDNPLQGCMKKHCNRQGCMKNIATIANPLQGCMRYAVVTVTMGYIIFIFVHILAGSNCSG